MSQNAKIPKPPKVVIPPISNAKFTKGREYEVIGIWDKYNKINGYGFCVVDNNGAELKCDEGNCVHIGGGNWTIKEREPSEAQIQSKCVIRMNNEFPETRGCFFAVTNNSEHAVRGLQRKALGMVAGVADTLFFWKGKLYCFEFKTEIGRQSDAQKKWQNTIENQGAIYYLVRSEDDFFSKIFKILNNQL